MLYLFIQILIRIYNCKDTMKSSYYKGFAIDLLFEKWEI
jgi:hypothetical protein